VFVVGVCCWCLLWGLLLYVIVGSTLGFHITYFLINIKNRNLNGQQVFSADDKTFSKGFAALTSDFIGAQFSNFALVD
jgi:hypothetical protein